MNTASGKLPRSITDFIIVLTCSSVMYAQYIAIKINFVDYIHFSQHGRLESIPYKNRTTQYAKKITITTLRYFLSTRTTQRRN